MSVRNIFSRYPVASAVDLVGVMLGGILIRTALEVSGTVPFWFTWEGAFRHSSDAILLGMFGAFFLSIGIAGMVVLAKAK